MLNPNILLTERYLVSGICWMISELLQGSVTAWGWPQSGWHSMSPWHQPVSGGLNTGLGLVETHHVTWILAPDWSISSSPDSLVSTLLSLRPADHPGELRVGATTNNKMRIRLWKQIVSSGIVKSINIGIPGIESLSPFSLSWSKPELYWSLCLWCWLPELDVGRTLYFKQWHKPSNSAFILMEQSRGNMVEENI